MKKIVLLSVFAIFSITNAQAELIIQPTPTNSAIALPALQTQNPPSDASIEQLMQVMHINDMIDSAIKGQKQLGDIMQNIPTDGATSDDSIFSRKKQQALQKVLSKYGKAIGGQLNSPQQREQMITAYKLSAKKNYTQDDVNALIGFYGTPAGQQLLHKQNQVSLDYIQSVVPSTVQNSTSGLEQMLPSLQQDIQKIFH